MHPDDMSFVQQLNDRLPSDPSQFDVNYRLRMPDGRVKELRVVAHTAQDPSGDLEFVGAVTDTTATKRAEEALRKSERQIRQDERELRAIVDFLPQLLVVGDAQGVVEYANRATLEFTGRTLEETVAHPDVCSEIVHPDDLPTVWGNIRAFVEGIGRGEPRSSAQ